jgi:16S rRNA (cytosine1402-N4)-methyltransferase
LSFEAVHTPVLPEETAALLGAALEAEGVPDGSGALFIDGTLGEGGHSELFLTRFPKLNVIGIDADSKILYAARERLSRFRDRMVFHEGWNDEFFKFYPMDGGAPLPCIILLDLGVSLFHYEKGDRGFSFWTDESLDMRIDTTRGVPASGLLSTLSEAELEKLLRENAEERFARRIAKAIVMERKSAPITRTLDLAELVTAAVPLFARHRRLHPATRTFAALRVAVNGELERLPSLLELAFNTLKPGGRLGVISFHSLEDRIVKNYFRSLTRDCICPPEAPVCVCRGHRLARPITTKPVAPTEAEVAENPPSRSAKLRVIEKVYINRSD